MAHASQILIGPTNYTIPNNLQDLSNVTVTSATTGQVLYYNGSGWVNNSLYYEVTGQLTAGSTSVTLSDARITTSSTVEGIWVDTGDTYNGLQPTSYTLANGSITLNFMAQSSAIPVKVRFS